MKTRHFLALALTLICFNFAEAKTRKISLHVEKLADGTHWMPKEVEVTQGEEVVFELTDKLEGMPLHGFKIEKLGIEDKVEFGKTKKLKPVTIKLDPGTYDITCQFHPAHVKATLLVRPTPPGKQPTETKS